VKADLASEIFAHTPYSIQDHWINLDGGRMRFLKDGRGPALLLVHGLLGYSFSWRYAIPVFAEQSTVHAVDMLGVGFSDRPKGLDCCLRASADRLLRFMDAAAIDSCDLLGTSHGGAVAMMAAALAPERVRRLILVAPVNPWSQHGKGMAAFLTNPAVKPIFLTVAPFLEWIHGFLLQRLYGDRKRIRPGTLKGYSAPFTTPGAFRYGLSVLKTWQRDLDALEAALPRIAHIPALIIWGGLDNAVDPKSARKLCEQFHSCRVRIFEGVGHLPYEEVPDEFNREVDEFISEGR
jgi:pimeloyl-ACP methyl ester carboxylesterase